MKLASEALFTVTVTVDGEEFQRIKATLTGLEIFLSKLAVELGTGFERKEFKADSASAKFFFERAVLTTLRIKTENDARACVERAIGECLRKL